VVGIPAGIVFGGEDFQFGRVLAGDEFGLRVEAGFEGIQAGRSVTVRPRGPVDLRASRRLAASCFSETMRWFL
jgi:hypothetical protein